MKRVILLAGLAAVAMSPAIAQDRAGKASQKFLTEAIEGNYAEVQMGELAEKNGQSAGVKAFGKMLAADHADANKKALDAAKSLGMTPPRGPNAKQKASYDKMARMSGTAFDKAFAKDMVADHKKDIRAYETASKKQDAAAQYAREALPTLHKHLDSAQSLGSGKSAAQ